MAAQGTVSCDSIDRISTECPFIRNWGVEFISAGTVGRSLRSISSLGTFNSWSVAHGGVLMSLLDVAMAWRAGR